MFLNTCGTCCLVISIWGVIQLALMGVFYHIKSVPLVKDVAAKEYKNFTDFINKTNENFEQVAINCWIAASIYVGLLIISIVCIMKGNEIDKRRAEALEDDDLVCGIMDDIPASAFPEDHFFRTAEVISTDKKKKPRTPPKPKDTDKPKGTDETHLPKDKKVSKEAKRQKHWRVSRDPKIFQKKKELEMKEIPESETGEKKKSEENEIGEKKKTEENETGEKKETEEKAETKKNEDSEKK